jgi:hypothetical protein
MGGNCLPLHEDQALGGGKCLDLFVNHTCCTLNKGGRRTLLLKLLDLKFEYFSLCFHVYVIGQKKYLHCV